MILDVYHRTRYTYLQPVTFGIHRCFIRPIEGHDLKIKSSRLDISPAYQIRWVQDVFNNCVALLTFEKPLDELVIESEVVVEQFNTNPFNFVLDRHAVNLPMQYTDEEKLDISPFLLPFSLTDAADVRAWISPFLDMNGQASTMNFLTALNSSVPMYFSYARRETPGVQSPSETLRIRSGSCRDFALLIMEAARTMGLAARFVSGYLCGNDDVSQQAAAGATHAWAEVYLPGAGWKGFDPTCGRLADDYHIRVAVSREAYQTLPVSGSYVGDPGLFSGLEIDVKVQKIS
ncbi:MAG: transglutaminase family protein [Verrucomicrobiota bacterium]|nr:transglutaminase family protein [Verrucomicrobiota bacterium]